MSTLFQQNLRKKTVYDPDAEFQDNTPDAYDPPAPAPTPVATPVTRTSVTPLPVVKESLISADLNISGKIEGKGNVRIAGRMEGDINIEGDLMANQGAQLKGTVCARQVTLAGTLEGNIESAEKVELLDSAVLIGDLKTGTLTISAGSRVRGNIQCGWKDDRAGRDAAAARLASSEPKVEVNLSIPASAE